MNPARRDQRLKKNAASCVSTSTQLSKSGFCRFAVICLTVYAFALLPANECYADDFGDANCDGMVDMADVTIIVATWGQTVAAPFDGADFNGNQIIDLPDADILVASFGSFRVYLADADFDCDADNNDGIILGLNWMTFVPPFENGDFNGDGFVGSCDLTILVNSFGTSRFCFGDVNCDGFVDLFDVTDLVSNFGNCVVPFTNGDLNGNGVVEIGDFNIVAASLGTTPPTFSGDLNGDGLVNFLDVPIFVSFFGTQVVPGTNGDLNGNGFVNDCDLQIFISQFP